jgi:hypothetical protein
MSERPTRDGGRTSKKKKFLFFFFSLPGDLAHEPPEEPRPLHEGMPGVACDGMHMLDDGFSTLALRPHYDRNIVITQVRVQ